MKSLEELKQNLWDTDCDSLIRLYHEALIKIDQLRKRLRKARQNGAMQCSQCGGYSLFLADGAQECSCIPELETTDARISE